MSHKTIVLIVFLLSISLEGFSQNFELKSIYCQNSDVELSLFFSKWEDDSILALRDSANVREEIEEDLYSIFEAFYDPTELERYGGNSLEANTYAGAKYIVVQDSLEYLVTEEEEITIESGYEYNISTNNKVTISNFYPSIQIPTKFLFLTDNYEDILANFFNRLSFCNGNNIADVRVRLSEKNERILYLQEYIRITYSHWGDKLYYVSHPYVQSIIFNRDATQAVVNYRVGWEGGGALFIKNENDWKMEESKIIWME